MQIGLRRTSHRAVKQLAEVRFARETELRKLRNADILVVVVVQKPKRRHDAFNIPVILPGIDRLVDVVITVQQQHEPPGQAADHRTVVFRPVADLQQNLQNTPGDFRMGLAVDDVAERCAAVVRQFQILRIAAEIVREQADRIEMQKSPAGGIAGGAARDVHFVRVDDNGVSRLEGEDLVADQKESGSIEAVADFEQVVNMRTDIGMLVPRVEIGHSHREIFVHRDPLKLFRAVRILIF